MIFDTTKDDCMKKIVIMMSFLLGSVFFQIQASITPSGVVKNLWEDELAIREKAKEIADKIVSEVNPSLRSMLVEDLLRENRDLKEQVKKLSQSK